MKRFTRQALWLAAGYAIFSALWIAFSDRILLSLVLDPVQLTEFQTYKGWLFVMLSTALVYSMAAGRLRANYLFLSELQARDATAKKIFSGVEEAVFLFDLASGKLTEANPAMLRMFGYRREDIKKLDICDLLVDLPESGCHDILLWVEALTRHPANHFDLQVKKRGGEPFWVEATMSGMELPAGRQVLVVARNIDARKELEAMSRERQRELSLLSDNLPGPVCHVDLEHRFKFVNRTFEQWFGKKGEEVIGRRREDVFDAVFCEELKPYESRVLENRRVVFESQMPRVDGSSVPTLVTMVPDVSSVGEVEGFFTILTDLSAVRVVESQLRESEGRYDSLFRENHAAMMLVEPQSGAIFDVNPAACRFYGYDEATFKTLNITELNGMSSSQVHAMVEQVLEEGQGCFELRHRLSTGELRDVEILSGPIEVQGRTLLYSIIHDITERNRAQERVQLLATAFSSSRDGMVISDLEPRILAVNPAFERITGYSEAEVVGENPRVLNSGRHDRSFFVDMWNRLTEKGSWEGEIWNRRKNGEVYPEWLSISTVYDEAGEPSRYVAVITDLSRLRKSEEERDRLMHYDILTNLPNRLLLPARLEHTIDRARRREMHAGVLVLDIAQFKLINNSLGEVQGDGLLKAVAERLRARLRQEDTLGRMGGDVFAVVVEDLRSADDLEKIAEDLIKSAAAPFHLENGVETFLQMHAGASLYPQDGDTAHELLSCAAMALSKAKAKGDRVAFYTPELVASARNSLELQGNLRKGLENHEFLLYYQPKVHLKTGRICGAEALVRWDRPGKGLVPPFEFIPAAERNGMIIPLGTWVIEEACRQMRAWQDAGYAPLPVAVNVSARQFRSKSLEAVIAGALENSGLPPEMLMVELTESLLMDDTEDAIRRMEALKTLGVGLSLDDFGTGYSSLAYLARFPIDQLKVDRSFVINVVSDPGAATIVNSVIALAHRMRLKVVAEGVEDEGQLGYLRKQQCDEMQGYYFSKPVPADEFSRLLEENKHLELADLEEEAKTLLLVDDERNILLSLRRLLMSEGYRVLTAPNGFEALETLARENVQVVVSDQRMPGMNGTEFLSRVKLMHPETVRLILSGYADLDSVTQAVNEAGLYKFLFKPWDDARLLEVIREAFVHHRREQLKNLEEFDQ